MFVTRKLDRRSLLPLLVVCSCLLLIFGFVGSSAAAQEAQKAAAAPVSLGQQLAISDFDGDLQPDLAIVQAGTTASGSTDYWIQLQLSAVGRESIRIVAPAGGLLIEARDVNGDHAVDLILSTSLRQPVAVFLNDGHGSFSRAEVAAFPGAFSECGTKFVSASSPATDALGVSPQPGAGVCPEENDSGFNRSPASLILFLSAGFPSDSFLTSHSGRAPPSEDRHC